MMTVRELSKRTGISVRTLHYYDEIGLLTPAEKSEAGYRLYDETDLEALRQILFFRELDLPLKEIRALMKDPTLDPSRILRLQRNMLAAKADRLARLIASIDDLLKGEKKMDFEVFTKSDIETLFQTTLSRMPDSMRQCIINDFGSIQAWKKHYIERASQEDMQQGYEQLLAYYGGDKAHALQAVTTFHSKESLDALQDQTNAILQKILQHKADSKPSHTMTDAVMAYGALLRDFCQLQNEEGLMRSLAASYKDGRVQAELDQQYGSGAAAYFAQAIESVYGSRP